MFIEIANKDKTGAIRLKGGGSSGIIEVKAPLITAKEKRDFQEYITYTNEKYLIQSAVKKCTREEQVQGAEIANEYIARIEAAASALEAEIKAANLRSEDINENKEIKKKVTIFDILDNDVLELINALRETLGHRVVIDADQLNKLKLKSNREYLLIPRFEEAFKGIGGKVNIPDGFID